MEKNQKDPKRKSPRCGTGLVVGLISGMLVTGLGTALAVNLYTKATDSYLVLGPEEVHKASKK